MNRYHPQAQKQVIFGSVLGAFRALFRRRFPKGRKIRGGEEKIKVGHEITSEVDLELLDIFEQFRIALERLLIAFIIPE